MSTTKQTTVATNQALAFINASAGLKHIDVTINNTITAMYNRTAKTAGAGGKGGLAFVNEVLRHESIAKGKSQSARAIALLMNRFNSEGVAVGIELFAGREFDATYVQGMAQQANTFFVDTLAELKASAKAKSDKTKSEKAVDDVKDVESDKVEGAAGKFELEADDVLSIANDVLVTVNGLPVAFGELVKAYNDALTVKALASVTAIKDAKPAAKTKAKQAA